MHIFTFSRILQPTNLNDFIVLLGIVRSTEKFSRKDRIMQVGRRKKDMRLWRTWQSEQAGTVFAAIEIHEISL